MHIVDPFSSLMPAVVLLGEVFEVPVGREVERGPVVELVPERIPLEKLREGGSQLTDLFLTIDD